MASPPRGRPLPLSSSDHLTPSYHHIISEKPHSSPVAKSYPFFLHSPSQSQPRADAIVGSFSKRRSCLDYILYLLIVVTLGTIAVLTTVHSYVGIYPSDLILPSELEVEPLRPSRVPKIIHQTWKTNQIPDRWIPVRESCISAHDNWDYMLWTDESGRELIQREYPWFLSVYDGYKFPIQRADAVRYFILHHYGGVYMDLDIGCVRPMDNLLRFDLVLPQTVPVGVSNDLMFSAKGHPFMDFIIHRLAQFDYDYQLNYATVMFSTGPMALSALLSLFRRSPSFSLAPGMSAFGPVRILPPKLYGKNLALPQPSPGPYFTHYYGSSWHTDGAGPVLLLGKFGIFALYAGLVVVALLAARGVFRYWFTETSSNEIQLSSSDTWPSGSNRRPLTAALWKRRLMRSKRAEGRLANVLLLPSYLLDKATTHTSKHPTRSLRNHRHKDCMQCTSCALARGIVDPSIRLPSNELPSPYCLTSGRRPPRKVHRNHGSQDEDDWEEIDEDTALLSSTSTSDFVSSPTPILHPLTPSFHQSSSATGFSSLRVAPSDEVGAGLPSPLLNAIYKLAEMAGIVNENDCRENSGIISPSRSDDNTFTSLPRLNVIRKVD